MFTALDSTVIAVIVLLPVAIWLAFKRLNECPKAPLPPGPKGLPLIKNLLDMPVGKEKETFTEWGKTYGPFSFPF